MSVIIKSGQPDAAAFKRLYDATGWGPQNRDASFYEEALAGSWYCVGAYEAEQLVGFGRIISDGKLHAFITEMIVHSSFQGRGIGKAILSALLAYCKEQCLDDIQLFAAPGKAGFYAREGFAERLLPAPGMQYKVEQNKR
jgi:GNAT superfamily N-acetyltransferase